MRHRRSSLLAALGVVLLGVQPARAISFYAEILTNEQVRDVYLGKQAA